MESRQSTPNPFVGFTIEELQTIGLALNDGVSRGWQTTLAALLKKDPSVVSKWAASGGIRRISEADVQHMRLLVHLKNARLLQTCLIKARAPITSHAASPGEELQTVREQINQAVGEGLA